MPPAQTIFANNLDFSYLTYGEGPLVLCLHGFPDSAHTWDFIGPALAAKNYRIVAPFLRGYKPTAMPTDQRYGALDLGSDALALISALGYESAIVIGHDWGALAAYAAANLKPEMVSRLITLAIPHPRSIIPSWGALWKARHFVGFQFRRAARRFMSRNNFKGVDDIYRRWSPTWDFPASETAYIKESFREPGRLDAALGYYWSFGADQFGEKAKAIRQTVNAKTSVPTLCLVGEKDGALELDNIEKTGRCFTDYYRYEIIPGVGHFPHREAPQIVLDEIGRFLKD